MKKKILLITILVITIGVKGQEKIQTENGLKNDFVYKNGNIGVGTTNPTQKLEIKGDDGIGIRLFNQAANTWDILNSQYGKLDFVRGGNNTMMRIDQHGNVGVGTSSPTKKMDVNGSIGAQEFVVVQKGGSYLIGLNGQEHGYITGRNSSFENKFVISSNGNSYLNGGNVGIGTNSPTQKLEIKGDDGIGIRLFNQAANTWDILNSQYGKLDFVRGGNNTMMRIDQHGNVGIGTTSPDMKLAVNGNIHAKEVKIDLNFPAPDYVFKDSYKLMNLEDVENFIKENSHLPEIPSAKEFEQNGVMQAEMDMNLLKKIEELTLYTIQQQKEIESLKKENEEVKSLNIKLLELQARLEKLESKK
ncbi:hypothetical protein [Aquimarina sp. LLG6339-5]|uniref:hypothetical protein n=1 Tax=Aquimarina sp. LLG6339-5 TaxID=3160830 RepID=UPI00386B041E